MDKNKITVFHGLGKFVDATHIEIAVQEKQTIEAKHSIIATGSKPAVLPLSNWTKSASSLQLKPFP